MKNKNIPVKWYCGQLRKKIQVSENAIYSLKNGWICDCGVWVTGRNTPNHKILNYDRFCKFCEFNRKFD